MNIIPIFLACDEKYAKYATVTMVSILSGTKRPVDLFVLDGGISNETKNQINMFLKSNHENLHNLEFITVDKNLVKDFPSVQHFSLNTYFRYFIANLKPEINRALYIDSDMVIVGDIAQLYDTDMGKYPVAAVPYICNDKKYEKTGHHRWIQNQKKMLGMKPDSLYFNAGLMMMDLDYFRKHDLQTKLVKQTIDMKDIITCPDQDILNKMFENNYYQLSPNYNIVVDITDDLVNINKYAKQFIGKICSVIHYTGGFGKRPWTGSHILAKYFWNVAKHTPFYAQLKIESKTKKLKLFRKKTSANGRVRIYFCGIKIASYKRKKAISNVTDYGKNNCIILIKDGQELKYKDEINGLKIEISGNNNKIILHHPITSQNCFINIKNDNAFVEIGSSTVISDLYIVCGWGNKQTCKIGNGTTIYGKTQICLHEESSVLIGEDCMLSNSISIWASDGHSILDKETNKILNKPTKPLVIGNHVWIGEGVKITKNTHIHDNSVIAMGAVCTKDYKEPNVIIAGNPATIIKKGINWNRANPYQLKMTKQ